MTETGEKLPPENGGDMGHIGGRKGQGRPLIHGQYKKPKPLKDLDRRTEEYQFRSGVIKGIESDFGWTLSFGEFTIAEILSGESLDCPAGNEDAFFQRKDRESFF